MTWTPPKTDWKIQPLDERGWYNGDWFNWADYERIRQNIEYLAVDAAKIGAIVHLQRMYSIDEIAAEYPAYTDFVSGAEMTDQMRFAAPVIVDKQLNPIERNLDILVDAVYRPPDFPATKTWYQNGKGLTYGDLNRWETCCQDIYDYLIAFKIIGRILPFTLKGGALSGV